ncbi:MAG: toxin-antitoxin system HicB family antitoxin [Pseudonocardia sp.]|nr:toxin-antitoxin system HicB family antitoxin [Pseudonocardia sp.]
MDVTPYIAQLREDLAAAAAAGDEQTRRTAALLGSAIEPAARLAIMNALSEMAAEVTAALGDRTVELRLDGREVRVSVDGARTEPTDGVGSTDTGPASGHGSSYGSGPGFGPFGPGAGPFGGDAGDISRVTLRIVEQIKSQAEQAAQSQGVSLNTWVSQAVQGALSGAAARHGRPGGPSDDQDGRRLRGWVQG